MSDDSNLWREDATITVGTRRGALNRSVWGEKINGELFGELDCAAGAHTGGT
jgi:hypothetical protein